MKAPRLLQTPAPPAAGQPPRRTPGKRPARLAAPGPLLAAMLGAAALGAALPAVVGCAPPRPSPRDTSRDLDLGQSEDEQAVVYGVDGRTEVFAHPSALYQGLARNSVVALIPPDDLDFSNPDDILPTAPVLQDYLGLCPDERFAQQPTSGNCSGTLIDDDIVLTAGHCVTNQNQCQNTLFVFDYLYAGPNNLETISLFEDVYGCSQLLVHVQQGDLDFSVVRLDRPATDAGKVPAVQSPTYPVTVGQPVTLIGAPTGIPVKIDDGGQVLNAGGPNPVAFFASVDAFGGNSGSGVFDSVGQQVGILVAGQQDYVFDPGGGCFRVNVIGATEPPGETVTYARPALEALCDTGFESPTLCPGNTDPICDACGGPADCPMGYTCLARQLNPNVRTCAPACSGPGDCPVGHTCTANGFCQPQLSTQCQGGDVYQVDSCGLTVGLLQDCPNGCMNGACTMALVGNTCDTAEEIPPVSQVIQGSVQGYSNNTSGTCAGNGPERVYTFTLDEPSRIAASSGGYDTTLHLRSEPCSSQFAEVVCDDDSGPGTDSFFEVEVDAGTYYLFMDAWSSNVQGGNFTLQLEISPAGECTDACFLGEQRCIQGPFGAASQTCQIGMLGCPVWGPPQPCGPGGQCSNGQCQGMCNDECDFPGEAFCLDDGTFAICDQADADPCWELLIEPCPPGFICDFDGCVPGCQDECIPGDRECVFTGGGDFVRECVFTPGPGCNQWQFVDNCGMWGCDPGAAACNAPCFECDPGDRICSAEEPGLIEECLFDGAECYQFFPVEFCPFTCAGGECTEECFDECVPGDQRCSLFDPAFVDTCEFGGNCWQWFAAFGCGSGQLCQDGECTGGCDDACIVGDRNCVTLGGNSQFVEECLDFGFGCPDWSIVDFCSDFNLGCADGVCLTDCGVCEPGDRRCTADDPFVVEACVLDFSGCYAWIPWQGCDEPCADGQCGACTDECDEGESFCSDDGVVRCENWDNDPCLEWRPPVPCGFGEVCQNGECTTACQDECGPGGFVCLPTGQLRGCQNEDGCWLLGEPMTCPGGVDCNPFEGCPGGCVPECTVGEARCTSEATYQACQNDDIGCPRWSAPLFCFGETHCEEGFCVLDAVDGGVGPGDDAGVYHFPPGRRPGRVTIASPSGCDQTAADEAGLLALALVGLWPLARRRAHRRARRG